MHVDREVRELGSQRGHQHRGRGWLHQARHVLDPQDVDARVHQLARKTQVVLQVVLGPRRVAEVRRVANGALRHRPFRLQDRLDAEEEVVDVIERVKDPEDVDAARVRLLDKLLDEVVWVGGVAHGVDSPQKHLERDVGDLLPQLGQPLPRALVQETHGHVERGPAPDLKAHALLERPRGVLCAAQQVVGPHARRQQALVRVSHRRVRQQEALVGPHALGKGLGSLLQQHVAPAFSPGLVLELLWHQGNHGVGEALGVRAHGARVLRAVHRRVGEVPQQLGRVVAWDGGEVKELRGGLDQRSVRHTGEELGVVEHVRDEGDVGSDAPDPELGQSALELPGGPLEGARVGDALDEQGVVVGQLRASGGDGAVQPYPWAPGGAVGLDSAAVRAEVVLRVLRGHASLDRKPVAPDRLLVRDADLGQRAAGRDHDLALHDVDPRDLLRDGVLHLHSRVHLQKVVAPVGGEHELDRAGVGVAHRRGDALCVIVHGLPRLLRDTHARGHLDDLLVPPLHAAVALVQVHRVAVGVCQDLDLNVPRVLDVLFEEHAPIAESLQRLVRGALVGALELGLLPHDAEPPATAAHGSLDHHREANLPSESMGLLGIQVVLLEPGDHGDLVRDRDLARLRLVAEAVQVLRRGPDEDDALLLAPLGKGGVLAQKAVTRVDGLDIVLLGDPDDRLDVQVRAHGAQLLLIRLEQVGLVGLVPVNLQPVLVAEDGDGADPELVRGAEDPRGDLAAVRAQQLGDLDAAGLGSGLGGAVEDARDLSERGRLVGSLGSGGTAEREFLGHLAACREGRRAVRAPLPAPLAAQGGPPRGRPGLPSAASGAPHRSYLAALGSSADLGPRGHPGT
mmetsp:Transcript_19968/g.42316  ORF Transcript_19968/g.42316 Transcript_19968/m.42316 type:complete len:851 (-) Transcript_19968:309-2861(-)